MPSFANVLALAGKRLSAAKIGRWVLRRALQSAPGRTAAIVGLTGQAPKDRRGAVRKLMSLMAPDVQLRFADHIGRLAEKYQRHEHVDIYWLALANSAAVENAWELLRNPEAPPHADSLRRAASRPYARAIAAYELARYKDAVKAFQKIQERDPDELKLNHDYLKAAYSAGKILDKKRALEFFARQYAETPAQGPDASDIVVGEMKRRVSHDTIATLAPYLAPLIGRTQRLRVGVFYLCSTEALGHAILDPYHFLALYRDRYDRVYFIGPHREGYRPASRVCLDIVTQHGRYLETGSEPLLNLSWMSLGCFEIGPLRLQERGHDPNTSLSWSGPPARSAVSIDLVVEHYWSLLREVVRRSSDPKDGFRHNAWHLELPRALQRFGEAFCEDEGFDLDKPLVVLHARDRRYHNIGKQSYRDADIGNYLPAIEHLLAAGYQVVRIGDDHISKLPLKHPRYCELPFLAAYDHRLDPFFISRARFMIGCQSGPCAYARAFGVPLLSVNAVLHYTLLPSVMEMACFKRYVRLDETGEPAAELDIEQALAAGASHFDNSYQYRQGRIGLEDATPDEILAAVKDMIAWLEDPDLPETERQSSFRNAVARHSAELKRKGAALDLPIADFLGIALPGYRISPSVAAMRAMASKPEAAGGAARRRSRAAAE